MATNCSPRAQEMVGACWPLAMVEQLELVGPNATLRTKFAKKMRYSTRQYVQCIFREQTERGER